MLGFDPLFDNLRAVRSGSVSYPPYNILKDRNSGVIILEMALAGFSEKDIDVIKTDTEIIIRGNRQMVSTQSAPEKPLPDVLYKGISTQRFERRFTTDLDVRTATFVDGMLRIEFEPAKQGVNQRIQLNKHYSVQQGLLQEDGGG